MNISRLVVWGKCEVDQTNMIFGTTMDQRLGVADAINHFPNDSIQHTKALQTNAIMK